MTASLPARPVRRPLTATRARLPLASPALADLESVERSVAGTSAPLDATLADVDARLKLLADPTRLRILNLLAAGELCVCDVVELLALPQPTVSRHLGVLRRAALVTATRAWKFAHYRLASPVDPLHQAMIACVNAAAATVTSLATERDAALIRAIQRGRAPCD